MRERFLLEAGHILTLQFDSFSMRASLKYIGTEHQRFFVKVVIMARDTSGLCRAAALPNSGQTLLVLISMKPITL
ncbi:MAG: hypothetical protein CM15mP89_4630 [Gammaproteobacteria bacterium]|nr:MAG: hypothetical protein CM15mP89_4630 [Gammaproteobacteria bacterium]